MNSCSIKIVRLLLTCRNIPELSDSLHIEKATIDSKLLLIVPWRVIYVSEIDIDSH